MTISAADLDNLETNINGANDWVGGANIGTAANGRVFDSIAKINAQAESDFDQHLATLGYEPPILFASSILVDRTTLTVEESGNIFAPLVSEIPFTTTGVFDSAQWYIITDFLPSQATNAGKILSTDATTAFWTASYMAVKDTTVSMIAAIDLPLNSPVRSLGFTTANDGGEDVWRHNGVTGQTVSQSPAQLGSALFNDGLGNQFELLVIGMKVPAESLGADLTAGVEATVIVQAATDFADAQSPKMNVSLGSGSLLLGQINIKEGVSYFGEGEYRTSLIPTANGITMFDFSPASASGTNASLNDCNINCVAKTGVRGVFIKNGNRFDINRVVFFGCDINWEFDLGGFHRVTDCTSDGTTTNAAGGFRMLSSDDTKFGAVFSTITNYRIMVHAVNGVKDPACFYRRAVGIKVVNLIASSTLFDGRCIVIENDSQGITHIAPLVVGFNIGLVMQEGPGVSAEPIINTFVDAQFDQCETNSILLDAGRLNTFEGGSVSSSGIGDTSQTVVLRAGSNRNKFNDMQVTGYNGAGGTAFLVDGSDDNDFDHVDVSGCTNGWSASNLPARNRLINCDASINVTNVTTGDWTANDNDIHRFKGAIPSPIANVVAPAVPASTVTTTNNFPTDVEIHVSGGTVTAFTREGKTIAFTGGTIIVKSGDDISLTYSSAPTWAWIGA